MRRCLSRGGCGRQDWFRRNIFSLHRHVRWLSFNTCGARHTLERSESWDHITVRAYTIKGAFLYHFSTHVEWPANAFPAAGESFVIGVFHNDPFGPALEMTAQTKSETGHPIVIEHLSSTDGRQQCHILFVSKSVAPPEQDEVHGALRGSSVLVVGEVDGFAEGGDDVQFVLGGDKVRSAIGAKVGKREELKVSSKLLSLAKIFPTK